MSKKKTIKLRLCPFCGRTPCVVGKALFWVSCRNDGCGADGPGRSTVRGAVTRWNNMSYRCAEREVFLDRNGNYGPRWAGTLQPNASPVRPW